MMTDRQREILFAIIEEYAETAMPVGSVTLAKLFGVSPATIRMEMAKLETMGLVMQPHTSAGRVPTDAGYRCYVNDLNDNLGEEAGGDLVFKRDIVEQKIFGQRITESKEVESQEIKAQGAGLRGAEQKSVEKQKSLERGTHALEVRVASQSRADASIRGAVDALVELTGNLGLATIGEQLYLSGISRLFTQPEFIDTRRVQAVAKLLDNLEPWLRETAPGEALNIFIGQENPIGKNSEVSLIISKFRSQYSDRSYIGVLGPTRQNYSRVMALVKHAGRVLEEIL